MAVGLRFAGFAVITVLGAGVLACSPTPTGGDAPTLPAAPRDRASLERREPSPRPAIDGRDFPEGVLALTWDDGPDAHTVELARYLAAEHVPATFFVVGAWDAQVSKEPGRGKDVYGTGYSHLHVLDQIVKLGHRLGDHSYNHALLTNASPEFVRAQLDANEETLAPFATNELHLFRAPGGYFNEAARAAIDASPRLAGLVGPVAWNVDRKDWESSLYCRSSAPRLECERIGTRGALRVKAEVVARRYLESIDSARRGIVLFHDRVGDVGSSYALEVARRIVPVLEAKGYVFAAPVLRFSEVASRSRESPWNEADPADRRAVDPGTLRLGDLDGDGREDICARSGLGVVCAPSVELARASGALSPFTTFRETKAWDDELSDAMGWSTSGRGSTLELADVDGDGKADLCARNASGIACGLATLAGTFAPLVPWSAPIDAGDDDASDFGDADGFASGGRAIRFGDVNGDGKADVCGRAPEGIRCATSRGGGFAPATVWTTAFADDGGWLSPAYGDSIELADVDGDGREDLCGRGPGGIICALSKGDHFEPPRPWTSGKDFADDDATPWATMAGYWETIRFADVNGDGRADVCGRGPDGIVCALSNGHRFLRATNWLSTAMTDEGGWFLPERASSIQLGDVNGDGRADVCGFGPDGLVCALAP